MNTQYAQELGLEAEYTLVPMSAAIGAWILCLMAENLEPGSARMPAGGVPTDARAFAAFLEAVLPPRPRRPSPRWRRS